MPQVKSYFGFLGCLLNLVKPPLEEPVIAGNLVRRTSNGTDLGNQRLALAFARIAPVQLLPSE